MVVEEGGPCFHSGLTTCILSFSRGHTLTPMPMPMPMPTTTSASATTSTRYRLPGTLIASPPPAIISRITTATTLTNTQITIVIIVTIIIIITITTTTIIRFKSISISLEISIIEILVSVCKVILLERTIIPRSALVYPRSLSDYTYGKLIIVLCGMIVVSCLESPFPALLLCPKISPRFFCLFTFCVGTVCA